MMYNTWISILHKKECVYLSVLDAKCVLMLKEYFLRSKVDKICREDRCSSKVNAHCLRILLEIISTEIISI